MVTQLWAGCTTSRHPGPLRVGNALLPRVLAKFGYHACFGQAVPARRAAVGSTTPARRPWDHHGAVRCIGWVITLWPSMRGSTSSMEAGLAVRAWVRPAFTEGRSPPFELLAVALYLATVGCGTAEQGGPRIAHAFFGPNLGLACHQACSGFSHNLVPMKLFRP